MTQQVAAYGTTIPFYLALHLWTSPSVAGTQPEKLLVSSLQAILVPFSVSIGYVVPVVLLILPSPSPVTLEAKQISLTLWNIYPIVVSAISFTLSVMGSAIFSHGLTKKNTLSSTRLVYAFAFYLATITHVASWSISLSSLLFPTLYSSEILLDLHPAKVFLPIFSHEATPWPLGMHRLLQWDNFVGSSGILAWATVLLLNAFRATGGKSHTSLLLKVPFFVATSGFVGAAAVLQWERDELLLGNDGAAEKKKR
jgi:hypothetical protein